MKRTYVAGAVVVALGLSAAALAGAKSRHVQVSQAVGADEPGRPIANLIRNGVRRLVALKDDLELTDEQRNEIRETVKAHRDELVPAIKDVMAKRKALRAAVLAESPDESAIRAAAAALGESIGDAAVLASEVATEVKPILTDEQKQMLQDFQADRQLALETFLDTAPD